MKCLSSCFPWCTLTGLCDCSLLEQYSDTAQYETSYCSLQGSEHRVGFSNVCKFHYFTVRILVYK